MNRMRILVTELPRMLHDIVREALARQEDMEVLPECPDLSKLDEAVRRTGADAVVLGCGEAELNGVLARLSDPAWSILAIVGDGRRGVVITKSSQVVLEDLSPEGLVTALRDHRPA